MSSQTGRLALQDVIEQGWKQLQGGFLQQLKKTIEGLLTAERDRRVAECRERGEKIYRWGYTVRKCWQTAWGALQQVRVPRLRGREEIGLLEKYQRHAMQEVLFALAVGGLSQRKVVSWVRRFLGGQLSPASIGAVLRAAQEQIQGRREKALSSGTYRALAVDGIYVRYRRSAESQARKGVLLVAVGVREGGGFEVLEWMAAAAETSQAYEELFTRRWRRGLEQVELIISDGAEGAASAAALVYPGAAHQLCLAHWFRNLEAVTPQLRWWQRRKFRREFWWIFEAEQESQLRKWAGSFARRWRFWAPEMVGKFQAELPRVLAYLRFPRYWRHRLRTTNLAEGFFRAEQQQWFAGQPDSENFGLALASDTEAYAGHLGKARELTMRAVDSAIRADSKENAASDRAKAREATSSESGQPIRLAGSQLGAQRHVCAFFHSPDEEYRVLLPFIKEGFERGEKASCARLVAARTRPFRCTQYEASTHSGDMGYDVALRPRGAPVQAAVAADSPVNGST